MSSRETDKRITIVAVVTPDQKARFNLILEKVSARLPTTQGALAAFAIEKLIEGYETDPLRILREIGQ